MIRPTVWTPEKREEAAKKILAEIATSELGLEHICWADKKLPAASTFYEWLVDDDVLAERYAPAREQQAAYMTDNVGVLATQLLAKKPTHSIDLQNFGKYLDAVKWRTAKLAPRSHGDKVVHDRP